MRKTLLRLFFTMLKIGLFTFGGGYAMIALLENEFVSEKKWLDGAEFLDTNLWRHNSVGRVAGSYPVCHLFKSDCRYQARWSSG